MLIGNSGEKLRELGGARHIGKHLGSEGEVARVEAFGAKLSAQFVENGRDRSDDGVDCDDISAGSSGIVVCPLL